MVSKIRIYPPLGSSDHLVECTLSLQMREVRFSGRLRTVWNIDKADWNEVNNALSTAYWRGVQDADDIDSTVSCWYSTFLSTIRGMIPCKRISHIKPINQLIIPDIGKAIKERKQLGVR